MRPRPDQLLTLTHWLVAAGIAGAAHLAVFLPTAGSSLVDHVEPQDAGVTLDLRVAAPATPAAPPAKPPPQQARSTLPATAGNDAHWLWTNACGLASLCNAELGYSCN